MSIQAMVWAFDLAIPGPQKLVLLALADFADEDGRCWPSRATIAHRASTSERTVSRHVTWLEEHELLVSKRRAGKNRSSNSYRLFVGATPLDERETPSKSQCDNLAHRENEAAQVIERGRTDGGTGSTQQKSRLHQIASRARLRLANAAQVTLIANCVPDGFAGGLGSTEMAEIADLIETLIHGGWTRSAIRARLEAKPIPADARSLARLLAHRIGELDPSLPPAPKPVARRKPAEDSEPPTEPLTSAQREILRREGWRGLVKAAP